jgi:circadian clock protein KaiC
MAVDLMESKKVLTYIDGLDETLGGGLPAGHVVLLSGLPGTMKSTLSYSILHRNAKERGAKCLYVSLEQTRKSLEDQMATMGFDVEAVRGDVHILDVGSIQKEIGKSATKPWMEFLRRTLTTRRDIDGVELVVIDSLEALEVLAKFTDRRTELFRFFEWLRDLGSTTIVLAEAASDAPFLGLEAPQPRRDEAFLADGIMELKMHPISDVEVQRRIRVTKMRGAHHKTGFSALVFEDGRFQVTPVISL